MKFIHTSDLHIGLRLCEAPMNGEIEAALDAVREIAVREACAAVIVAGDIYDRAAPSSESVALFDRFVTGLTAAGIPILAIPGNHDSAERVGYLSALLDRAGAHFSPVYDGDVRPVTLYDADGPVDFWLLPFFRPVEYRAAVAGSETEDWGEAAAEAIGRLAIDPERRSVLVAHQFAARGEAENTAGGVGRVDPAVYAPFDYTALGHLHRAHAVGRETVRYSGSPVKCSFDEADDVKSVTLVTLEGRDVRVREIPLPVRRDVRQMRGTYEELVSPAFRAKGSPDDYLRAILTDEEDVPDAVAKLRTVYPNLLRLSYDNLRTRALGNREIAWDDDAGPDALTPESVFAELWERQQGAPPDEETVRLVKELFRAARAAEGGGV